MTEHGEGHCDDPQCEQCFTYLDLENAVERARALLAEPLAMDWHAAARSVLNAVERDHPDADVRDLARATLESMDEVAVAAALAERFWQHLREAQELYTLALEREGWGGVADALNRCGVAEAAGLAKRCAANERKNARDRLRDES